jgi:molecular chaperone GrpE
MSDDPRPDGKENGEAAKDEPAFSVVDKRPRFDGDEGASPEPRFPSFVEELKARAEEAERRAREISAAYRRIDEERDAFRQRLTRDLERRVDIARAETMRRILPVLDDLDRALLAARGASEAGALLSGVTIIRERLRQALASEGVEALATAGKPFDPQVAEAVATEETDDPGRDNLVVQELEAGYSLGGTLLRPARVKVARLKGHAPGADH